MKERRTWFRANARELQDNQKRLVYTIRTLQEDLHNQPVCLSTSLAQAQRDFAIEKEKEPLVGDSILLT